MSIEYEWISGGKCVVCGEAFEGLHLASKQTCGNTCRQKLHRYRDRVENVYYRMYEDVSLYETTLEIEELREVSIEKLQAIYNRIGRILNRASVQESDDEEEYSLF